MIRIIAQDIKFILWIKPQIQSESGKLLCNSHATLTLVGRSCLAGQYFSSQVPALGKIIDAFSPPKTSIAPSATMKVIREGRRFLVTLIFTFLCPTVKICHVSVYLRTKVVVYHVQKALVSWAQNEGLPFLSGASSSTPD